MVFQLDNDLSFPDPHLVDADGLLAIGGDLSIDRLLLAYGHGIFPWFSFRDRTEILWWCPMQRFVIYPEEIHVSHSLRTLMNKDLYHCTIDKDFDSVIRQCSQLRIKKEGAWLGKDMINAYTELHRQGFAHSVEVWDRTERLVGGLYGVGTGSVFAGESMFSLVPSASKLALVHLARTIVEGGGGLIDCQFETPHLKSMGGKFISYEEYIHEMWKQYDDISGQ